MKKQLVKNSSKQTLLEEFSVLKEKYDVLKKDTEDFIASAKHLSDSGAKEARELIESAKQNWDSIVSSFNGSKLGGFLSKSKKPAMKKRVLKAAKKVTSRIASVS